LEEEPDDTDEWWDSGIEDIYTDMQKNISRMIVRAMRTEKKDKEKSIDLYIKAYKDIEQFDKVLENDPLVDKAWCQEFDVKSFRSKRYPIVRLSLLL